MNWTGGQLHRHIKEKQNKVLKAQKEHFARAAVADKIERALQARPGPQSAGYIPYGCAWQPSQTGTGELNIGLFRTSRAQLGNSNENRSAGISGNNQESLRPCTDAASETPGSLKAARDKLLNMPDWLGLCAVRPVKIRFTPAEEMAQIGRPKRLATRKKNMLQDQSFRYEQRFHSPLLGKRKRTATSPGLKSLKHVESDTNISTSSILPYVPSSPPGTIWPRRSSPVPSSHTSLSLPPLPPIDYDRSNYRLALPDYVPDHVAEDLLSLEEARSFKSFSEVQERCFSSRLQKFSQNSSIADRLTACKQYRRLSSISTSDRKPVDDARILNSQPGNRCEFDVARTDRFFQERVNDREQRPGGSFTCTGNVHASVTKKIGFAEQKADFEGFDGSISGIRRSSLTVCIPNHGDNTTADVVMNDTSYSKISGLPPCPYFRLPAETIAEFNPFSNFSMEPSRCDSSTRKRLLQDGGTKARPLTDDTPHHFQLDEQYDLFPHDELSTFSPMSLGLHGSLDESSSEELYSTIHRIEGDRALHNSFDWLSSNTTQPRDRYMLQSMSDPPIETPEGGHRYSLC